MHRCPNMAVKEAEENDLMDDNDDDVDNDSTSNGVADKRTKQTLDAASGKTHHRCARKPTVGNTHYRYLYYIGLHQGSCAGLEFKAGLEKSLNCFYCATLCVGTLLYA